MPGSCLCAWALEYNYSRIAPRKYLLLLAYQDFVLGRHCGRIVYFFAMGHGIIPIMLHRFALGLLALAAPRLVVAQIPIVGVPTRGPVVPIRRNINDMEATGGPQWCDPSFIFHLHATPSLSAESPG